jgi:hypothetical protein
LGASKQDKVLHCYTTFPCWWGNLFVTVLCVLLLSNLISEHVCMYVCMLHVEQYRCETRSSFITFIFLCWKRNEVIATVCIMIWCINNTMLRNEEMKVFYFVWVRDDLHIHVWAIRFCLYFDNLQSVPLHEMKCK